MVDGLSIREDELTSALASGLGPVPLFGGSAGDGTRFKETFVLHEGRALRNAAVLAMVRSDCRVKVFSLDHLVPTERAHGGDRGRSAHAASVRRINAEPAAREYARLLGKDPAQLSPFTFAAHPVVVRMGGKHHVRAIQQVAENGDLVFFSAIDEGLVLTLAEPQDMVGASGAASWRGCREGGAPEAILACDCILRRMEAMEKQRYRRDLGPAAAAPGGGLFDLWRAVELDAREPDDDRAWPSIRPGSGRHDRDAGQPRRSARAADAKSCCRSPMC